MTNQTWKAVKVKLDNASGTLTAITNWTNQYSAAGAQAVLEDSAFGTEEATFKPGIENGTFSLNGFLNTTTDAIFSPLVGNHTSVSKTFSIGNGVSYLTGEAYPTNTQTSGSVNALGLWSSSFQITGAATKTSVEPS